MTVQPCLTAGRPGEGGERPGRAGGGDVEGGPGEGGERPGRAGPGRAGPGRAGPGRAGGAWRAGGERPGRAGPGGRGGRAGGGGRRGEAGPGRAGGTWRAGRGRGAGGTRDPVVALPWWGQTPNWRDSKACPVLRSIRLYLPGVGSTIRKALTAYRYSIKVQYCEGGCTQSHRSTVMVDMFFLWGRPCP